MKIAIFGNVRNLKGSKFSVHNDYSPQTLRKRKLLSESAKAEKNNIKKVYLVPERLKIDKDEYIWDEWKNERGKVTKHTAKDPFLPETWLNVISADKQLRLGNINARSLANETDMLEVAFIQDDPHVAILTETYLREELREKDVFLPSYTVFRKERSGRGGGRAVLLKSPIEAVSLGEVADLECLCISLSSWGQEFILYALYRPPDAPIDYLEKLQAQMTRHM